MGKRIVQVISTLLAVLTRLETSKVNPIKQVMPTQTLRTKISKSRCNMVLPHSFFASANGGALQYPAPSPFTVTSFS